jgi:radical SAM enzyme (TIGR01210 family)
VPPEDLPALADLAAPFERVVVECHPLLVDGRCADFQQRLGGVLELALGLETVHPQALERLNKRMSLGDFERACARAHAAGIALRAFVLVGTPFVPAREQIEWLEHGIRFAIEQEVEHVSILPVRATEELATLAARGDFAPPRLQLVEEALAAGLALQTESVVIDLDTWDLDRHAAAPCCAVDRRERLLRMSATGVPTSPLRCPVCGP